MKLFIVFFFAALCAVSIGQGEEEDDDFVIPEESKLTKDSKEPATAVTRHSLLTKYDKCESWKSRGKKCYSAKKNECPGKECLYETKVAYLKCSYGTYIKVPLVRYYYPPATQCNKLPLTWCKSCTYKSKCRTTTCAARVFRLIKVNQYYYTTEVYVPFPCCKCHY